MRVQINRVGAYLYVHAPYNPLFNEATRPLAGVERRDQWQFDARDEADVRQLCRDIYGDDGTTTDQVTLAVRFLVDEEERNAPLQVHGRGIAIAMDRDGGATACEGVVVKQGKVTSGGSKQNPATKAIKDTIVYVRDFPRAVAERLVQTQPDRWRSYGIVQEPPLAPHPGPENLAEERARLAARIEEINELLATITQGD